MGSLFAGLPEQFFVPLASPNKHQYAGLLLAYYRLFLEYRSAVERDLVVARFASYLAAEPSNDGGQPVAPEAAEDAETAADPRAPAHRYLRNLIGYGWLDEEEQADFSRHVTMQSHARPFLEALDATERGTQVEYESHIVAVYASLTGDAAQENGEHAVLNAHYHTRLLIESLKVLEQNIRTHVQALYDADATIPEILHRHYDLYMHEVIDRAYTRLKTSDNLSRYRPRIARAVAAFLDDHVWLARTADRLSIIHRTDRDTARERARRMLIDIREELKSIDPILESIDDRNRRYSRISTERIRSQLLSDSSLHGRIAQMIGTVEALAHGGGAPPLSVQLHRLRYLNRDSLYTRRSREVDLTMLERPPSDKLAEEIAAEELRLRAAGQLNPTRVGEFLSAACPEPGDTVSAERLVDGMESFVRLLYAAGYAERSGDGFPFDVTWSDAPVTVGRFRFREHHFTRRYSHG